ncbi:type II toxin-antitoxin system VapC family toxin [Uliginosibacterium paludis]|uniref:PIN domain-containing protein n=1 Tax=Uliginosibacterium paludis TaxID=1615952 RepID=A0ABV2CUU9_9RHOO
MKDVLVDTSVWVEHFRERNDALIDLLTSDRTLMHPLVLGELACGTPPARTQTLGDLALLRPSQQATLPEAMAFIEREALFGLGCGLVDVLLLASTLMTPDAQLWTLDKRLADLAVRFGVLHRPALH